MFFTCFRNFPKSAFGLLLCVLLSGCVLQSTKPLYSETDGKLLLKSFGENMLAEFLDKGSWKSDGGILTFTATGNHYVVTDAKKEKPAEALFADVGEGLVIMQFSEKDAPATYVMVEPQKDMVLVRPLMCSELKDSKSDFATITFSGQDCTISAKPDAATAKAWLAALRPAAARLRPAK